MKMLTMRLPQGRWLATLALATVLAFAAPLGAETTSPPCSDPEGVALNLMTQVFKVAETPEGRAALPSVISAIGGVFTVYAPNPALKVTAVVLTQTLNGLVAVHNTAPPSLTQIHQNTSQFVQSLPPQQQSAFAQQLVKVARGYSAISLQHGPPGGICLDKPKIETAPGIEEQYMELRKAAGQHGEPAR